MRRTGKAVMFRSPPIRRRKKKEEKEEQDDGTQVLLQFFS
jgi:hypothetical protein